MQVEIMIDKEQKISQATLDALEAELLKNLHPHYPAMAVRIRRSSATSVQLTGLRQDEDKKNVMNILQAVWEDDSWLH
ncbi:DinI family protein [Cronobacter sakazakii]|uniref:DinI-like family protein n=1 Tax=Cronobacter sakazakii TaxID=28141 RepID=UPI001ED5A097|nr:DinI-like family protein [Cronobacter sakazakii]EGT4441757.1 DinI family protein [Cronobacter sakazakii]ELY5781008.1 DinI family protein [Cronobacter sakazakii]UNM57400.1 DinI family protein [Cronobacter sakazakii]